jgi:hypothetical protein
MTSFLEIVWRLTLMGMVLAVLGLPVSAWISAQLDKWQQRIAFASAPLWGAGILAIIGAWGSKAGLLPIQWTSMALVAALFGWIAAGRGLGSFAMMAKGTVLCFATLALAVVLVLLVDGRDLTRVGPSSYFPLTNADTFNYLGHIEQLRERGSNVPRLLYPNDTSIRIEHAIYIRAGCVAIVASLLDIVHIDTAAGFFLSLRLGMAMSVIGAVLLTGSIVRSIPAMALVGMLAVGSNVLMFQTLQQFLSSIWGVSQLTAVGLAATWAARQQLAPSHALLLGLSVGAYALVCPEAHPFVLLALSIVLASSLLPRSVFLPQGAKVSSLYAALAFVIGYAIALGSLADGYFIDLFGQLRGATHHPGDFFAGPGAILHAAGISPWEGQPLSTFRMREQIAAFGIVIAYSAGTIVCLVRAFGKDLQSLAERQIALLVGVMGAVVLAAQCFAYVTGRGYLLQKLLDYFSLFLLVVMAAAATFPMQETPSFDRYLAKLRFHAQWVLMLCAGLSCVAISLPHKTSMLDRYVKIVASAPSARDYQIDREPSRGVTALMADLGGDVHFRFLWENRRASIPMHVPDELWPRFSGRTPLSAVSHVVRIAGMAVATSNVVDINRPRDGASKPVAELVPVANYVRIVEGAGWLGPEGGSAADVWRWLSDRGEFTVLRPCTTGMVLTWQLTAGPDLGPDNDVEFMFNGRHVASIRGSDLKAVPSTYTVAVPPLCGGTQVSGSIVISGSKRGIRQVRVGSLYLAADKP